MAGAAGAGAGDGASRRGRPAGGSVVAVLRVVGANPELRRVELAFAAFTSGDWAAWLAMLVYAYLRGGVTESGLLATVMLVPAALLAPVAAALGERHAPGRALVCGYVVQTATCAAVAAAMLSHAGSPLVFALLVAYSVAFTMTRPTQAAFAPALARIPHELTATNVVSGWTEGVSTLAAPALAGVVLALASPGAVFALVAAGCAIGAAAVWPLRAAVPAPAPGAGEPPRAGTASRLRGSARFVRRDAPARTLVMLLGAQCVALGALDVLYGRSRSACCIAAPRGLVTSTRRSAPAACSPCG